MYYYLGLEARQRQNIYNSMDEAIIDAAYISNRLLVPIRIFAMRDNRKSELMKVIRPNSTPRPLGRRVFSED